MNAEALPLAAHHRDLERSFLRAIRRFRSGDLLEGRVAWMLFERELTEHFVAEEHQLIPAFRGAFPGEALQICQEHRGLRDRLGDLALKLDLSTLRHEHVMGFVVALTEHADRETQLFYPWAAQHLPAARAQALGAHLESLSREVTEALGDVQTDA